MSGFPDKYPNGLQRATEIYSMSEVNDLFSNIFRKDINYEIAKKHHR